MKKEEGSVQDRARLQLAKDGAPDGARLVAMAGLLAVSVFGKDEQDTVFISSPTTHNLGALSAALGNALRGGDITAKDIDTAVRKTISEPYYETLDDVDWKRNEDGAWFVEAVPFAKEYTEVMCKMLVYGIVAEAKHMGILAAASHAN